MYVVQGLVFLVSLAWALAMQHQASLAGLAGAVGASMIDDVAMAAAPLLIKAVRGKPR